MFCKDARSKYSETDDCGSAVDGGSTILDGCSIILHGGSTIWACGLKQPPLGWIKFLINHPRDGTGRHRHQCICRGLEGPTGTSGSHLQRGYVHTRPGPAHQSLSGTGVRAGRCRLQRAHAKVVRIGSGGQDGQLFPLATWQIVLATC